MQIPTSNHSPQTSQSLKCVWETIDTQIASQLLVEERNALEVRLLGYDADGFAHKVVSGPDDVLRKVRAILGGEWRQADPLARQRRRYGRDMMIVYVLTNPAMPGLVKIGYTQNEDANARIAQLYTSGVPVPFNIEFACRVENAEEVERALHFAFGPNRVNPKERVFRNRPSAGNCHSSAPSYRRRHNGSCATA